MLRIIITLPLLPGKPLIGGHDTYFPISTPQARANAKHSCYDKSFEARFP